MTTKIKTSAAHNEFISYLEKIFSVPTDEVKVIIKDFHTEMQNGLSGFESSLKMIPSFTDRASGTEKGKFIALDLGGTNFRVIAVDLDGKGGATVAGVNKYVIDKKHMEGTGEELFDFIANCIKGFMESNNISMEKKVELAFTFSFPVDQTNIAAGKLMLWTKGFTASGVEGEDIVVLLNEALKRIGISNLKVAALVNDTVGTLVAKSYTEQACDMGVILGTGTNACYPEKIANIKKWRGISQKGSMIINMEWGNFDKLFVTPYDKDVDAASPNPGKQRLEKMVSGMFLGRILREILRDLIKRDLIFKDPSAASLFAKYDTLKTEHMSLIEGDNTVNLGEVDEFLSKNGLKNIDQESKDLLKHVSKLVSQRSARLSAAAIAAVVLWMDPELKSKHVIGIDGSLFEKYPGFKEMMEKVFTEVFKKDAVKVVCEHARDGSGVGAAIIAAIAASEEK